MEIFTTFLLSPVGWVEIGGTATHIHSVQFVAEEEASSPNLPAVMALCKQELEEYFAGKRKTFSVPVNPEGTDFQKKVWNSLMQIKYGETTSYLNISEAIGDAKAVRAVGHANGKNPVAIIIPCHRVISTAGKLTGYAGGMWRKQWLLDLEGNVSGRNPSLF